MAGGISKRDVAGIIESGFDEDDESVRFCPHCLEYGLYNELGPRIYEILKPNQKRKPLPRDADEWLQCNKPNRGCGRIYARYQSKVESSVKDFIEPSSNPFDEGKSIVSLDNKMRLTPTQKARQKQRDRIEQEKDEDIKRELKKGLQVDIIEDSMNY